MKKMSNSTIQKAGALLVSTVVGLWAIQAHSQPMLEEITVTAQKRAESLQDIGAAVTAMDSERLSDAGVTTVLDLQNMVPGLSIGTGFGHSQIFIRGIGMDVPFAGGDPSVAMHLDGAVIGQASAQLGAMFDIERIEVLRGPQGTLYGRNATGGSINVISKKPTEEFEGYTRLTAGNLELFQFEGAVSGAISDNLLGRFSAKIENRGGYGTNINTGEDIYDANRKSFRGQLQWLINENADFLLSVGHHSEDDSNYVTLFRAPTFPNTTNPGLMPQPLGFEHDTASPYDLNADTPLVNDREQWYATATLNWNLSSDWDLSSISNYHTSDRRNQNDFDFTDAPRFAQSEPVEAEQFSQELQLSYSGDRLSGLVGAYYYDETIERDSRLISDPTLSSGNDALNTPIEQADIGSQGSVDIQAMALFANAKYSLTDELTLILGGRYSYEKREGHTTYFDTPAPAPPVTDFREEGSFNDFSPKVGIEWDASPDVMFYANVSTGFKSGVLLVGQTAPILDPETVDAFEVGMKGRFQDNRLQLNLSGFYYDFKDLQIGRTLPAPGGFVTVFENAASAENQGIEIEATWLATESLRFDGFVTYLDATFKDFDTVDPFEATLAFFNGEPAPAPKSVDGNRLIQSPEWSATLRGQYEWLLASGASTSLAIDMAYKDKMYFTPQNYNAFSQDAHELLNANLKYISADENWSINLWGKNLTDELVYTQSFILNTTKVNATSVAAPRTFGVTLGYEF